MRITLEIDDDLVEAARQLARQRHATMGEIVCGLMRQALEAKEAPRMRNGVPLFTPQPGAAKPNLALVNRLLDEE